MADNDGSEPLSDEPIIMSFAMSVEEWAMVAASLTLMGQYTTALEKASGNIMPDKVRGTVEAGGRFARMIEDEVGRWKG